MQFTNLTGISLSLAVWLAHDEYDYINTPNYISVTSLMKPLRHIILPSRIPRNERDTPDVSDNIARALGHSLHDSIEKSWVKGYRKNLAKLGVPEHVINRVLINPTDDEVRTMKDCIPVYLEQRAFRKITIGGVEYTIGGKFDLVAEGIVHDNKSTSSFVWTQGTRDDEHSLQGSLYRWIDAIQDLPKITEDFIRINYIFTDWKKSDARQNPKYPQQRVQTKDIELMSEDATTKWVTDKLSQVLKYQNAPEPTVPECTPEEIWQSDPVYKYYNDPAKANDPNSKSTKNFTDAASAKMFAIEKGNKGVIKVVPAEPKRCEQYCDAFTVCTQKNRYFQT